MQTKKKKHLPSSLFLLISSETAYGFVSQKKSEVPRDCLSAKQDCI